MIVHHSKLQNNNKIMGDRSKINKSDLLKTSMKVSMRNTLQPFSKYIEPESKKVITDSYVDLNMLIEELDEKLNKKVEEN